MTVIKSGAEPVCSVVGVCDAGLPLKYHMKMGTGKPLAWQVRLTELDVLTLTFCGIVGIRISAAAVERERERAGVAITRDRAAHGREGGGRKYEGQKRKGTLTKNSDLCSVIVTAQIISGLTGVVGSVYGLNTGQS